MSNPRTPSIPIKNLTNDLADKEIAPKLDLSDLARLFRTSKAINLLFKKPFLDRKISTLVEQADYDRLETIAMADPARMFNQVMMKVPGETQPILISPLLYAFKTLDTHMWQLILKAIQHSQNQALLDLFTAELHKPIQHVNWQPLFVAYEYYINQSTLWMNKQITLDTFCKDRLVIGVAQHQCLSMSVLKIFCDPNTNWKPDADFTANESSRPKEACLIKAYYYDDPRRGRIEKLQVKGLGSSFFLYTDTIGRIAHRGLMGPSNITSDLATFRRLLAVRTQDFENLKKQSLSLAPQANRV